MSDVAIQVDSLGKMYRIGGKQEPYKRFTESVMDALTAPVRRLRNLGRPVPPEETLWALKDVSFEVKQGEAVGIIGRNGAGKSTLLKVLSRITEPTEGEARVYGRVGSLLEVGTGFHPELTGRENVYLNGAILGMTRAEINRKFDEIVDFSGVEKFIDTPVKRYSSGMQVRLAFAVAAHLEPEILVVDEVLAVGDAEFQKKCLGKMGEVAQGGRTVLFVSHNMGAISRLCGRAVLLDSGKLKQEGLASVVTSSYLQHVSENVSHQFSQPANETIPLCLLEANVFSADGSMGQFIPRDKPITVRIIYKVNYEISSVHIYSNLFTGDGTLVMGTSDSDVDPTRFGLRKPGIYTCQYQIPAHTLNEGGYTVSISLGVPYQINYQENHHILAFTIVNVSIDTNPIHRQRRGVLRLDLPWNYLEISPFER